ncbi:hypothetical protein O181_000875 [Austropuccinia psidii MF-1]|uniref:Uncharacterized protein n=1 Tax=Austropuccinia psidii MF-1 TaxID=1389203 RepID=A0A9Q3B9V7_9BASI|nr:hypothetical protein [Austropuccinia psidii MF-1]
MIRMIKCPPLKEKSGEQRRNSFMAHEEGTPSDSEFPHPQITLIEFFLDQSEMRQQRNQAFNSHNVAKPESQKEKQRFLKEEFPDNVHGMRSAVHAHFLFLLKVKDKDFYSLPELPSPEENAIEIQVAGHLQYIPKDLFNEPSKQVQCQVFQSYFKNELHKLGLEQFTWDWESLWKNQFNEFIYMVFYHTFQLALVNTKYNCYCWKKNHNKYCSVSALMEQYFTDFKREWK